MKLFLFRKILFVFGVCVCFFIPTRVFPQLSKIKSSRRGSLVSVKLQNLINNVLFSKWILNSPLVSKKRGVLCFHFFEISFILLLPWGWLQRGEAENIGELFPSSKFTSEMRCMLWTSKHGFLKANLFYSRLLVSTGVPAKQSVGCKHAQQCRGQTEITATFYGP